MFQQFSNIGVSEPAIPPKEVDRSIARNARKPLCGAVQVFQLRLPLESFDESLLSKILRVIHISNHAIDQEENSA
jgi:hypothetical protein